MLGHAPVIDNDLRVPIGDVKCAQKAISETQAKFAQVSAARADLKQAQIQAQTNTARQQSYNSCKACQQIDILHALPSTLTTLVLGNNSGVSLTVAK